MGATGLRQGQRTVPALCEGSGGSDQGPRGVPPRPHPRLLVARFSGKRQVAWSSFPFGSVSIQLGGGQNAKNFKFLLCFLLFSCCVACSFVLFLQTVFYQTLKLYLLNRADLRTPSLCKSLSSTVFHSFLRCLVLYREETGCVLVSSAFLGISTSPEVGTYLGC